MNFFEQTVKNLHDNFNKDYTILQKNEQLFTIAERAAKDHPELDISLSNSVGYYPVISIWLKKGQIVRDALRFVTTLCKYRRDDGISTKFSTDGAEQMSCLCVFFEDDITIVNIWITSVCACKFVEVGKREVPIRKLVCDDGSEIVTEGEETTNDKSEI